MNFTYIIGVLALSLTAKLSAVGLVLAPKLACGPVFTVVQAKQIQDLISSSAETGNVTLFNQLQEMRQSLPTYDTSQGAYFYYESGGLTMLTSLRAYNGDYLGMPGAKRGAESMENFVLEYHPEIERYGSLFRSVFGTEPLRFDFSHVQFVYDGMFTMLPGKVLNVGLAWKASNGKLKEALLMVSRDTGQIFLYPQTNSYTGTNTAAAVLSASKDFVKGLTAETRNIWAKRTGDWFGGNDVKSVNWYPSSRGLEIALTPTAEKIEGDSAR